MTKLELTKAEARHLVNIINDYMQVNPNYLEVTIDVISQTEVETQKLLEKLIQHSIE